MECARIFALRKQSTHFPPPLGPVHSRIHMVQTFSWADMTISIMHPKALLHGKTMTVIKKYSAPKRMRAMFL